MKYSRSGNPSVITTQPNMKHRAHDDLQIQTMPIFKNALGPSTDQNVVETTVDFSPDRSNYADEYIGNNTFYNN